MFTPSVIFIVHLESGQLLVDSTAEIGASIFSQPSASGGPGFDIRLGQTQIVDITAIGKQQSTAKDLELKC